uniref:Uncharacterized protein n=1 Tax=Paramormyrops kingsleyae TaxID=1676925 RepID=A0A3B3SB71_9TELE
MFVICFRFFNSDLDGCEPRKRVCKDGARTKAKITRVSEEMCAQSPYAGLERHMHLEDDVSAEASGPNASAMFVANNKEAQIMVGAEIASASVSAGPVGMKVGLGVETGARVGDDGAEVKVLGCGMSIGRTMGASFFGNELKFRLW